MKTILCLSLVIVLAALAVAAMGCKSSHPGSREFIPGKGWVPN